MTHMGACGKPRVVPHNRRPQTRAYGNGRSEVRVLLSTYGSRGDVEPMVGLAVRLWVLGAEGCDALVATDVTPAGAWR
jgi:vancomycin aglycone glucosyltransferase